MEHLTSKKLRVGTSHRLHKFTSHLFFLVKIPFVVSYINPTLKVEVEEGAGERNIHEVAWTVFDFALMGKEIS